MEIVHNKKITAPMDLSAPLPYEPLPLSEPLKLLCPEEDAEKESYEDWFQRMETLLLRRLETNGGKDACFVVGHFYFLNDHFGEAREYYERALPEQQAMYQLAVMFYEGIHIESDPKTGVEMMTEIAKNGPKNLRYAAQYNVARAWLQGIGVPRRSDEEGLKWLLLAADDGNPKACVRAQTTLGLFYASEHTEPHSGYTDFSKSFFWHTEACGNGSLESQGCLGLMFEHGIGTEKNIEKAFECYREAANRGSIYAGGHLTAAYYRRKMYTKCVDVASRILAVEDLEGISKKTDCLLPFIRKGMALAAFYYGRCLDLGKGVKQDKPAAGLQYSASFKYDADICAQLQGLVQQGRI